MTGWTVRWAVPKDPRTEDRLSRELLVAASNLTVDALTGKVVGALREGGVESLLLKGPVVARRLYPHGETRSYADCDLLVRERQLAAAEAIVATLGLVPDPLGDRLLPKWERHGHTWLLAERNFALDLHWSLIHVATDADMLWEVNNRDATMMRVGGVEVLTPGDPQLAVILALHAAQHGAEWNRPQEDLSRALDIFPSSVWRSAAALAAELQALPAFAAGLRLASSGEAMASRLNLPECRSFEVWLTTGSAARGARAFDRFARAPGLLSKARVATRTAFPSPMHMRQTRRLARHGLAGLAVAYAWQPVHVTTRLQASLRAWRHARRETSQRI